MKNMQRYLATGVALVVIFGAVVCYGDKIAVSNYTDGTGYYSWSLTRGDEDSIWGVGTINMELYGVQYIWPTPGWGVTNDQGYITWTYTNGTWWFIHDTAVVFAVDCSFTNSTSYTNNPGTDFFQKSSLGGAQFSTNHTDPIFGGTDEFIIMGPYPTPTVSTFSISNSQLHFAVEEMIGSTCYVERSYNLLTNDWQTATNFTVETINTNLTQPLATNQAFYRLRLTR